MPRLSSTSTPGRAVGWQLPKSLRSDFALDDREMGLMTRAHAGRDTTGVIAHSDRGVQCLAVAEYVDWFNHRRLHGEIGLVPVEFEEQHYRHNPVATTVAASVQSPH